MSALIYYTDGSCKGNGKEESYGAWGWISINEYNREIWRKGKGEKNTTNQRQELMAVIQACKNSDIYNDGISNIYIFSDSAYIINCFGQGWYLKWQANGWVNSKKEAVANVDLWEQLIPYFNKANYQFRKVKGHAGDYWNEQVDEMVQKLAEEVRRQDEEND